MPNFSKRLAWLAWLLFTLLTAVLYLMAFRWPISQRVIVVPTELDQAIPMLPWAAPLYLSYFLLLPTLILSSRNKPGFAAVFIISLACGILNAVLFIIVPSQLAYRPVAPVGSLLALIQTMDPAQNVIPSGHVSLPFTIALMALLQSKRNANVTINKHWYRLGLLYLVWAALIVFATLVTRQHYLIDVAAGLGLALLIVMSFHFLGLKLKSANNWIYSPTIFALLMEWVLILFIMVIMLTWSSWPVLIVGVVLLASRQHALLVLYHEGVHFLIAGNREINDTIINLLAGIPFLMPVHQYRALHLSHHRDLGTAWDPEKVVLYRKQNWNYQALGLGTLLWQLMGDLLLWNSLRMLYYYYREKRPDGQLRLVPVKIHVGLYGLIVAAVLLAASVLYFWPLVTLKIAAIWFGTYVTVTQLLQKLRSYAEHTHPQDDPELTCSWRSGFVGQIFLWPYNINFHKEHHKQANLAWYELPQRFSQGEHRKGTLLIRHIWRGRIA